MCKKRKFETLTIRLISYDGCVVGLFLHRVYMSLRVSVMQCVNVAV